MVVKVTSTGVCGSDLSALKGTHLFRKPPLISGHEAGGIIEAVGEGVTDFKPGDRVVIDPQRPCGECVRCTGGNYHLCPSKLMLGAAEWDGSFAHFVEVPAYTLIPAPDSVADEDLALAEPIAVAVHAVRQARADEASSALVLGGGTIGSLITQVLADKGVQVTVSEPREFLHQTLRDFGASRVVTPEEDPGSDYDITFIVAGLPQLVTLACEAARPGGEIVEVAVFGKEVPVHVGRLQVQEKTMHGTAMYQKQDFADALTLMARHPQMPSLLVSRRVGLDEGADLITRMAKEGPGDILKLIIIPGTDEDATA